MEARAVWKCNYLEEFICHVYSPHSAHIYQVLTMCRLWSRQKDTMVKINKVPVPLDLTL